MWSRLLLTTILVVSISTAMEYSGERAAAYARIWADWERRGHDGFRNYFERGGNCCKFVSRCMTGSKSTPGGGVKFWGVREEVLKRRCYRERTIEPDKEKFKKLLDNENHFYSIQHLRQCLSEWEVPIFWYSISQLKNIPPSLKVGDLIFVPRHIMIVVEIDREKKIIYFADHHGSIYWDPKKQKWVNTAGFFPRRDLVNYIWRKGWRGCEIAHMPSRIRDCMDLKQVERWDSTFGWRAKVCHSWICCWHERLGEEWPWTSNPTPYACLTWSESRGRTWDTLISPCVNLLGCSSVVFIQDCTTNLRHKANTNIEIRGSTDDGATWPYLIGTDTTTQAPLPWAANQRKVRIAWIYTGPVQSGRFWCIDNVRILAKPTRYRDISVPEIRIPHNRENIVPILISNAVVRPVAFVWNAGKQDESLSFTFKIGDSYTDTRWMRLPPYYDTFVEFSPWITTPGTYTATCFASLDSDEFRGNDTATLTFRVVADTWLSLYPVYGGDVGPGACITRVNDDELYCATGRSNFFGKYIISQNLWKGRRPTPRVFRSGAGIAYAYGNSLYAISSSQKLFFSYNIQDDRWSTLSNVPDNIGPGGALVYGGNNYLYALRGGKKRSFYRYNISINRWDTLAPTPDKIGEGGSLVWTGGDFIYALRGDSTNDFYRYRISTNQWEEMAPLPTSVGAGGSLAYHPLNKKIYAFSGNNRQYFYSYDIDTDTWSQRKYAPSPVRTGGCLTYGDYSVFGILGTNYDKNFCRYSPRETIALPPPSPPTPPVSSRQDSSLILLRGDAFPSPSHLGNLIAFLEIDTFSGNNRLFIIPADSFGEKVSISESLNLEFETPAWSPEDSWIACAGEGGLYKISTVGNEIETLDIGISSHPSWSPEGNWICYSKWEGNHKLYKVKSDGSERVCLTDNDCEYLNPEWSPTSNIIVCQKLKDGVYQLYSIDADNCQETQLTSDYCHNTNPSFSPEGAWITYEKLDHTGYYQVYKINIATREEFCLTSDEGHHTSPKFSPDGAWIVYIHWPIDEVSQYYNLSRLGVVDATSGANYSLTEADAKRDNPEWMPDGSTLIYEMTTVGGEKGDEKGSSICKLKVNLQRREEKGRVVQIPKVLELFQNKPNPFRKRTWIKYAIPSPARVKLVIYDLTGRTVKTLVDELNLPNYYTVIWDGKDEKGNRVSSGIYFYEIQINGRARQRKMLLLQD